MSSNSIDSASETAAAPASKKSVWIQRGILVAAILALVAVYFLVPAVHEWVGSVFAMFATGDFSAASDFMAQYGPAAAVVSFLLMVFQSVIAPLPAFLITIANANLFGWWQGAILSWTSAMAGAALCFWIARVARPWRSLPVRTASARWRSSSSATAPRAFLSRACCRSYRLTG